MTLNERLAAFFREHPGEWIDGKRLATFAGGYGWRSRCSDLRTKYGMTIENKVVHHRQGDARWTTSLYRYVPDPVASEAPSDAANLNAWSLQ